MDLKAARLELGMTQVEMGKIMYLTSRQVINIEKGKAKVPPLVAEKMERLLKASVIEECTI